MIGINNMDKEDKIKMNKHLLSESFWKYEFSVESQILHHCGVRVKMARRKQMV